VPFVLLLVAAVWGCSDYRKARSAYEAGEYKKALHIFEQLSNDGDSQAQYDLSQMYLQGIGTNKNLEKGLDLDESGCRWRQCPSYVGASGSLSKKSSFGKF
jgi:TPR repeat protein